MKKLLACFLLAIVSAAVALPGPVKIGFAPFDEPQQIKKRFEAVRLYLEKETGYRFDIVIASSHSELEKLLCGGRIDLAYTGAYGTVYASDVCGAAPLVISERRSGGTTVRSLIITGADSGIDDIGDLRGRHMAFSSPYSTTGFRLPFALFKGRDFNPYTFLGSRTFMGADSRVISAVSAGVADAGAVSSDAYSAYIDQLSGRYPELKVIWRSAPVPGNAFVASKHLSRKAASAFSEAMVLAARLDPEAVSLWDPDLAGWVEADPSDYIYIRNLLTITGQYGSGQDRPSDSEWGR